MPHSATGWTAATVRALPNDGNRYEVVDGELLVTGAAPRGRSGWRSSGILTLNRVLRD